MIIIMIINFVLIIMIMIFLIIILIIINVIMILISITIMIIIVITFMIITMIITLVNQPVSSEVICVLCRLKTTIFLQLFWTKITYWWTANRVDLCTKQKS